MLGSEWICSGCLCAYLISVAYFRAFVPGFVSVLWLLPAYLRLEAFIFIICSKSGVFFILSSLLFKGPFHLSKHLPFKK